jgi:hypothetical protein
MNLDELIASISDSELKNQLKQVVLEWKMSNSSIENLSKTIEKWHGNVWFSARENSDKFYKDFCEFKISAINNINGMTLNERLYWFGLFDIWDKSTKDLKKTIRFKLKAD